LRYFSHEELLDHVTSLEHSELIAVLNRSVPAIIQRIRLLPCTECSHHFRLNIALKLHMRSRHSRPDFELPDQERFHCSRCSYWSYKAKAVSMHEYLVHPNRKRKHRCRICCKEFAKEEQLRQHRSTASHREAVRALKQGPDESNKSCSYCGQDCVGSMALKKHLGKLLIIFSVLD
jgi:hypothetical protein